jgi:hypothetical protein
MKLRMADKYLFGHMASEWRVTQTFFILIYKETWAGGSFKLFIETETLLQVTILFINTKLFIETETLLQFYPKLLPVLFYTKYLLWVYICLSTLKP